MIMNKTTAQPKPKFLIAANKSAKLSVQIPQKLSSLVSEYQNFHKEVSGEEVALDALVSAFINAAIMSDKSFINWKKEGNKAQQQNEAELKEARFS